MRQFSSDIAFTPAVKSIQSGKGSRSSYARMESGGSWETSVTPELEAFLSDLDMFYLGTANAEGQPSDQVLAKLRIYVVRLSQIHDPSRKSRCKRCLEL